MWLVVTLINCGNIWGNKLSSCILMNAEKCKSKDALRYSIILIVIDMHNYPFHKMLKKVINPSDACVQI